MNTALKNWKASKKLTQPQMASAFGKSLATVLRWLLYGGHPVTKADFKNVFIITDGHVDPNSFFPMDEWWEEVRKKSKRESNKPAED